MKDSFDQHDAHRPRPSTGLAARGTERRQRKIERGAEQAAHRVGGAFDVGRKNDVQRCRHDVTLPLSSENVIVPAAIETEDRSCPTDR